jgi:hypothetical protein
MNIQGQVIKMLYFDIIERIKETGYDSDAYTYYGPLRTPKRETITVNGEEVSRIELGRRLVGALAKTIEINGKTFEAEQIGKIFVDALDEATNSKLDAHRYEHMVEMAKRCGADIGYELDWLIRQALFVWKNTDGGKLVARKEYMPNTIELCKTLHISTERDEDETEEEYNDRLAYYVDYRWKNGTAEDRVDIFHIVYRTVHREVYNVFIDLKPVRATANDEETGEFDRDFGDEEVKQDVEE